MFNKKALFVGLLLMVMGAVILGCVQFVMHKTNTPEFCVSCHAMSYPKEEWEGSVHFSNRKGIRAQCADCHIPEGGWHYVKAKFIALKDVWYTFVDNKLPDQEAYEAHRLELAKHVWEDMKNNDSMTCRSCHSMEAMAISEQSDAAQKMHKLAQETNQTCIDCHKGIVHFMPEMPVENNVGGELSKYAGIFNSSDKTIYSLAMTTTQLVDGGEVRLMPYSELNDWQESDGNVVATLKGWQQVGAESVVYMHKGQRIMVALLGDDAKDKVKVLNQVYDEVTASDWKEISLQLKAPKTALTANIAALNQFGDSLNQTHCSGCHAVIGADHYTANQWIGVVNSMKDRTSMSADDVRAVTIYLQRNAKDIVGATH